MAKKSNLVIDQGATFYSVVILSENNERLDLTSYTGASQMRKHYSSTNAVSFDVQLTEEGEIVLSLTAEQTEALTPGRYLYDVELTDSANIVSRIVEGIVTVTPNITR